MNPGCRAALLAACFAALALAPAVFGDEGMWLFNKPPTEYLKKQYGFDATEEWLEHVQKSSVRFNTGGSGSFVSPDGLVMTNHHVGADSLQKIDDDQRPQLHPRRLLRPHPGRGDEVPRPGTQRPHGHRGRDQARQRRRQAGHEAGRGVRRPPRPSWPRSRRSRSRKTGLRSDVVTLYQGGVYNLYRYKKYTDVRLVFAPEQQIAFFGGDPDNFEYPRFDLDICFFRVYENGKPIQPETLPEMEQERGRRTTSWCSCPATPAAPTG